MLTVACVCVPGGEYDTTHVVRLQRLVENHLNRPFDFHIVMASDKPGWWAKIDLFEPGRFRGRVLYLDLDTTPVGPLEDLADYPAPFVASPDRMFRGINSSVMAWDAGYMDRLYTDFRPEHMDRFHGDQDYINARFIGPATFPPDWCPSYKRDVLKTGLPAAARVIVYHGRPKPWEVE